jgi:hypothetical protein
MSEFVEGDDLLICEVAHQQVLSCWCGPHLDCPEHYMNCVVTDEDWAMDDRRRLAKLN